MTKILDRNAEVLRKTAKPVVLKDISSKKIQTVISKMKKILATQEDGVAIAAPQIGESLRIFVVSGLVTSMYRGEDKKLHTKKGAVKETDIIFINPKIIKKSKTKKMMEEGCLSVRWLYGLVERSEKATVEAYNEMGKKFTTGASGLMAQIFQHETDHLDGILFIDKAVDVHDMPPPIKKKGK